MNTRVLWVSQIDISKFSIIENYLWTISKNGSWYILQFSADWQGVHSFTVSIRLGNFHLPSIFISYLSIRFYFSISTLNINSEVQCHISISNINLEYLIFFEFPFEVPFWDSVLHFYSVSIKHYIEKVMEIKISSVSCWLSMCSHIDSQH